MSVTPLALATPVAERVSLETVKTVLTDAAEAINRLDGQPVASKRTELADQGRSLLHLADILALAASVVRNEYWHTKEMPSYDL